MIPVFLLKFAGRLVGERFAKAFSWVLVAGLVLVLLAVGKCSYDKAVISDYEAETGAVIIEQNADALADAAEQRTKDEAAVRTAEEARNHEIAKADKARTTDAAARLACERLRRSGQDTSGIARCAGFARNTEAPADR